MWWSVWFTRWWSRSTIAERERKVCRNWKENKRIWIKTRNAFSWHWKALLKYILKLPKCSVRESNLRMNLVTKYSPRCKEPKAGPNRQQMWCDWRSGALFSLANSRHTSQAHTYAAAAGAFHLFSRSCCRGSLSSLMSRRKMSRISRDVHLAKPKTSTHHTWTLCLAAETPHMESVPRTNILHYWNSHKLELITFCNTQNFEVIARYIRTK